MSTDGRSVFGRTRSSADGVDAPSNGRAQARAQGSNGAGEGGGPGGMRRKRRRQRGQRNKRHTSGTPSAHGERANRERVYQDVEGLLRQIRELAEETSLFTQQQLDEFTQMVVGLFKALEGEGELVSDRLYAEYQRVREKLNLALRDQPMSDQENRP